MAALATAVALTLYFSGFGRVWLAFHLLWIINAATYAFITCFTLLIEMVMRLSLTNRAAVAPVAHV